MLNDMKVQFTIPIKCDSRRDAEIFIDFLSECNSFFFEDYLYHEEHISHSPVLRFDYDKFIVYVDPIPDSPSE